MNHRNPRNRNLSEPPRPGPGLLTRRHPLAAQGSGRAGSLGTLLLLAMLLTITPGCAGFGFLADVAGGDQVKAAYTLQPRPTLVLVDDPTEALGDDALRDVIAQEAGHRLVAQGLVPSVVPVVRIQQLRSRKGDVFREIPMDALGRELGAQQVVMVTVQGASLQLAMGVARPSASIDVRVIDATTGARLFPDPGPLYDPLDPPPGAVLTIRDERTDLDPARPDQLQQMARDLAQRVGLEVARLFYDHRASISGKTG